MVSAYLRSCRTIVSSRLLPRSAVTLTSPVPIRTSRPATLYWPDGTCGTTVTRFRPDVGADPELVVHDRPQDAVGAPGLQADRPLGELLLDVRAEVGRRRDLRHRAGDLPHRRVELHLRVAGGVALQLGLAIRPSAASATAMIEVFRVNTDRSDCTVEVAVSQVGPVVAAGRRSWPRAGVEQPVLPGVAGLLALLRPARGRGRAGPADRRACPGADLGLDRRHADPVPLEDLGVARVVERVGVLLASPSRTTRPRRSASPGRPP